MAPNQRERNCLSLAGSVEEASAAIPTAAEDVLFSDCDGHDDTSRCRAPKHCDCSGFLRAQLAEAQRTARQLSQEKAAVEQNLAEKIHVVQLQNLTVQSLSDEVVELRHDWQHLTQENDELLEDFHAVSAENDGLQTKLQVTQDKASGIMAKGNELLEERDWLLEQLEQCQRGVREMVTADEVSNIVNQIGERWGAKMKEAASEKASLELKLETVMLERDVRQGMVDKMEQEKRAMQFKVDSLNKVQALNDICATVDSPTRTCASMETRERRNKRETNCEKGEGVQEFSIRQHGLARLFRAPSKTTVISTEHGNHVNFVYESAGISHKHEKPACAPQKYVCPQQKHGINLKCSGEVKKSVAQSFLHAMLNYH